ncbi:MAG: hypothetical protein JRF33_25615 [Deltaproteobacteria bacterium]|nr:hypothetical protein [Deltaproteobacteria bacterium]
MIRKSLQALLMLSTLFAFLACGGASEEECDLYCGDHGSCEFVEGEATCVCQAGYKGYNCETEIDRRHLHRRGQRV